MAETFSVGDRVSALWGHTWYAGVVDDILDGGRAYEIACARGRLAAETSGSREQNARRPAPAVPDLRAAVVRRQVQLLFGKI